MPAAGPSLCPVCGQWCATQPCAGCLARFAPPRPRCPRCALALAHAAAPCARCMAQRQTEAPGQAGALPWPVAHAITAFDYRFPWDGLVARLKFNGDLALARPLAEALEQAVRAAGGRAEWLLPMPLAASRLRQRGYNQAWEIARRLAPRLGITAHANLLLRWRDTPQQIGLTRQERQANLRGSMMPAPGARAVLAGRHVALIDDVLTTGASAAEACRALGEAGVARVDLWVLARTP